MSDLKLFNQTITNENTQKYLKDVLGEKKNSFVNNITALVSNNASLQKCDAVSVLYAGIKATALDLPLDANLGFAYVIPYGSQAQFQIGYKGFKQLALRTGLFRVMSETDVKEGEIKSFNRLTGEIEFDWISDYNERKNKHTIGYVSYFKLQNGFESTYYRSIDEINDHGKKYSKMYQKGSGLWKDEFDSMALKTVVKLNLSKNAPLSIEMQTAILADQAIITDKGIHYIDNDIAMSENNEKAANILSDAINNTVIN